MNLGEALLAIPKPPKAEPKPKSNPKYVRKRMTFSEWETMLLEALTSPKTVLELAAELNLSRTTVRDKLRGLMGAGRVKRSAVASVGGTQYVYWRKVK